MGNLPESINFGAITIWLAGVAANYDNAGGVLLFALGVLAVAIKIADNGMTYYKNHIKKK